MIQVIKTFLLSYRVVLMVGVAGLVLSSGAYILGDTRGYARADKKCVNQQQQILQRGIHIKNASKKEIMAMSDDELNAYMRSKWMRD